MTVEYFTDGASSMRKKGDEWIVERGGCAYVKIFNNVAIDSWSYGELKATNQKMELMAILAALKDFKKNFKEVETCIIYTDSAYSLNTLTQWAQKWKENGWKRKGGEIKNLNIIKEAMEILDSFSNNIKIVKVKGHSNNKWNCLADSLAVKAKQQTKNIVE